MIMRSIHVLSNAVTLDKTFAEAICWSIESDFCAASMHVFPILSNQIFLLGERVVCFRTRERRKGRLRRMVEPQ